MGVALVTGANRGIGRVLAEGLAAAGHGVGLLGRDRAGLARVAGAIAAAGGRAAVAVADIRDAAAVAGSVDAITAELGDIDLLVNNAGVIDPVEVPVWEADPDAWWDVVETDLRGPFHLVRAVVPGMVARGHGRVIALSSGAGAQDRPIYSAYCVAKAGQFRLTGALHLAGHDRGLRAFELSPGVVRTDMTTGMAMHDDRTDWTAPQDVLDLALAIARGELDAWSGCFLRAGLDTPETLRAVGEAVPRPARRLVVHPYSEADPLTP